MAKKNLEGVKYGNWTLRTEKSVYTGHVTYVPHNYDVDLATQDSVIWFAHLLEKDFMWEPDSMPDFLRCIERYYDVDFSSMLYRVLNRAEQAKEAKCE